MIVDAAFLKCWQRDVFCELALRHQVFFRILDIEVEPEVRRKHINRRATQGQETSKAGLRVLQHQIETAEPQVVNDYDALLKMGDAVQCARPYKA